VAQHQAELRRIHQLLDGVDNAFLDLLVFLVDRWPAAIYARLETLRAKGRSMEPTIADGALLMLDRAQDTLPAVPKNGQKRRPAPEPDVYVFAHNGDIRLKRLQRLNEDFIAIHSDNRAEFPPEIFDLKRDGSFKVIGKVIWWDNRL
jgi:phage repressor protein C with HTH and peptisase S24 domain